MTARYIKLTRPDGQPILINANDPPRRISPALEHDKGKTALIWSAHDVIVVLEPLGYCLEWLVPEVHEQS